MERESEVECLFERKLHCSNSRHRRRRSKTTIKNNEVHTDCNCYRQSQIINICCEGSCAVPALSKDAVINILKKKNKRHKNQTKIRTPSVNDKLGDRSNIKCCLRTTERSSDPETNVSTLTDKMGKPRGQLIFHCNKHPTNKENCCSTRGSQYDKKYNHTLVETQVNRCQKAATGTCCCNCNSEAMFEVMKSLYDCYKNKNCKNCTCVLCGPCGIRPRKLVDTGVGEGYAKVPSEGTRQAKEAGLLTPLEGKSTKEKERIFKGLAMLGMPLTDGKTSSEVKLIKQIRRNIGLPEEPQKKTEKETLARAYAAGIVTPLIGKTKAEKERVLRRIAAADFPLPEGRTASEISLIRKGQAKTEGSTRVPAQKLRNALEAGLLTPLEGKTNEEKKRILRCLAKAGIPLPEGTTSSRANLIKKIKKEMGLPADPQTASEKERLAEAYAAGIVTPLEGKSRAEKEKALCRMAAVGVPLPTGRTASEKSLIRRVKATIERPLQVPCEKLRKAKEAGLLTSLKGKTQEEKENTLRGLAKAGIPLPDGKTPSEVKLIKQIKRDMGLPSEPQTASEKVRLAKAYAAGIVTPLEGKKKAEKEKALRRMAAAGVPLPEGRTATEKSLIRKVKATTERATVVPAEKLHKTKEVGLLTTLEGKMREEKECILRGLAKAGLPLPEGETSSETKLIKKIKKEMGLPAEPQTVSGKERLAKAYAAGIVTPLEGKSNAEKEKALRRMVAAGVPLPEGRTASEKSLIRKVKATSRRTPQILSEKLRKAKAAGLMTPLEGKTHEEKVRILRGLAKGGIPLPERKTSSEVKLIMKIRRDMGLPEGPQSKSEKERLARAYAAGIVTPLEGKTKAEKEKALRRMAAACIPLPEGRTASEKSFIRKVKATTERAPEVPTEKLPKAKEAGLLTPLEGKNHEEKKRMLRCLAKAGIPLPEGKTLSKAILIKKVKKEMGSPGEPQTVSEIERLAKAYAAGIVTPLEFKSNARKEKILRRMAAAGVPLPENRTASEKSWIKRVKTTRERVPQVPSEKLRKANEAGLITPLEGKTHKEKERILRCLAKASIPLPEGKTLSEVKLMRQIRRDMGWPEEPQTKSEVERLARIYAVGIVTPIEGKTQAEKEKALRETAAAGIPLPEGRTSSEVKLIKKVKKEMGLPAEPQTVLEEERLAKAYAAGIVAPLEGKSRAEKEKALCRMAAVGVPLPKGRTASEKSLIRKVKATTERPLQVPCEKLRKAKEAGLLTPLKGKTQEAKENTLRGLAKAGIPLPDGKTPSEVKLVKQIKRDMGLPPEPQTASEKLRLAKAYAAGIVTPLEGKTKAEKEKALRRMAAAGVPLPEGRTATEKCLITNVKATTERAPEVATEKLPKAKEPGLLIPLKGKTHEEKERILRCLAKAGIPLPEGKTSSEAKLIMKIQKEMGLLAEPQTVSENESLAKAYAAGIVKPPCGKSNLKKEKNLCQMAAADVPLPKSRTASEKSLIKKIKATTIRAPPVQSEKLRNAKEAELLAPLEGKTHEEKKRMLRCLTKAGIPIPESKTSAEAKLIHRKVKKEMGLPAEAQTVSESKWLAKAYAAGIITPLEDKSRAEKEKALCRMAAVGVPLPKGRTASEKSLIRRVKAYTERPLQVPSEKLQKAKKAGFLTLLEGKSQEEKEHTLRDLAQAGNPLPEGKTLSEVKLIRQIRRDMGWPEEPQTKSEKEKLAKAYAAGIVTPLEGKTEAEKEKALRRMAATGAPLPKGQPASEKSFIRKIKATTERAPKVSAEKLPKDQEAGLLIPLEGKTHEEKERILRCLAKAGIPLPEGKTSPEAKLIKKIIKEMGLPSEPQTASEKERLAKAYKAGIITPLEKDKALRLMAAAGAPLPKGRTDSEKSLIKRMKATIEKAVQVSYEKLRKAKEAGLPTSPEGKIQEEKERILRGLAKACVPLPEGKTTSKAESINKIKREMDLPEEPRTTSEKDRLAKAYAAGIVKPLKGKSLAEKEQALRGMVAAGLNLPEDRTASEKSLIKKNQDEAKAAVPCDPSEKVRKAKEAGLLTPLTGKSKEEKEKILRCLAILDIPLPEGQTPSEVQLIKKVQKEMGFPPEPRMKSENDLLAKAHATGFVSPLKGKTNGEKEEILAPAGAPLPEGRTKSEQDLIDNLKATTKQPISLMKIAPDELKKAKKTGLLTSLEVKSREDKETVWRGLAKAGMPLPEGKTATEKQLIRMIKYDLGLPPEPYRASGRIKLARAYAAGLVTPLEGKSRAEKDKALKRMAAAGIPLPVGRTESEKELINKIKAAAERAPKIPVEKLRKAKEGGYFTPLKGKTSEEKEQILRGLTGAGLPLPTGKTESERRIIQKVRKEMGLPVEPQTPSEKIALARAYAAGIVTPLEGKITSQKEQAYRKMMAAGIPLPEPRTASEKSILDNLQKEYDKYGLKEEEKTREVALKRMIEQRIELPEGRTYSERALIQKVRASVTKMKKRLTKAPVGMEDEVGTVKTTKCDRECGCDRKKIKFKHSYIKIRVTSPDISTFCPCPNECLPGIKGGEFVDNDGIKITVGNVIGVPSFTPSSCSSKTQSLHNFVEQLISVNSTECFPSENGVVSSDSNLQLPPYIVTPVTSKELIKEIDYRDNVIANYGQFLIPTLSSFIGNSLGSRSIKSTIIEHDSFNSVIIVISESRSSYSTRRNVNELGTLLSFDSFDDAYTSLTGAASKDNGKINFHDDDKDDIEYLKHQIYDDIKTHFESVTGLRNSVKLSEGSFKCENDESCDGEQMFALGVCTSTKTYGGVTDGTEDETFSEIRSKDCNEGPLKSIAVIVSLQSLKGRKLSLPRESPSTSYSSLNSVSLLTSFTDSYSCSSASDKIDGSNASIESFFKDKKTKLKRVSNNLVSTVMINYNNSLKCLGEHRKMVQEDIFYQQSKKIMTPLPKARGRYKLIDVTNKTLPYEEKVKMCTNEDLFGYDNFYVTNASERLKRLIFEESQESTPKTSQGERLECVELKAKTKETVAAAVMINKEKENLPKEKTSKSIVIVCDKVKSFRSETSTTSTDSESCDYTHIQKTASVDFEELLNGVTNKQEKRAEERKKERNVQQKMISKCEQTNHGCAGKEKSPYCCKCTNKQTTGMCVDILSEAGFGRNMPSMSDLTKQCKCPPPRELPALWFDISSAVAHCCQQDMEDLLYSYEDEQWMTSDEYYKRKLERIKAQMNAEKPVFKFSLRPQNKLEIRYPTIYKRYSAHSNCTPPPLLTQRPSSCVCCGCDLNKCMKTCQDDPASKSCNKRHIGPCSDQFPTCCSKPPLRPMTHSRETLTIDTIDPRYCPPLIKRKKFSCVDLSEDECEPQPKCYEYCPPLLQRPITQSRETLTIDTIDPRYCPPLIKPKKFSCAVLSDDECEPQPNYYGYCNRKPVQSQSRCQKEVEQDDDDDCDDDEDAYDGCICSDDKMTKCANRKPNKWISWIKKECKCDKEKCRPKCHLKVLNPRNVLYYVTTSKDGVVSPLPQTRTSTSSSSYHPIH